MTVKDLINILGTLPLEAQIMAEYDGGLDPSIGIVWHPRWGANGQVEIGQEDTTVEIRGTRLWPLKPGDRAKVTDVHS